MTAALETLVANALTAAQLPFIKSSLQVGIEEDSEQRHGPRVHWAFRLRSDPKAKFSGEHEIWGGWTVEEIAVWIAARCLESKDWPHWRSLNDGGTDPARKHLKVGPLWGYGWGPVLQPHTAAMTGRES